MKGFEIIDTYSTAQAVNDGVLFLVPEESSKEAGIIFPVYLSEAVYLKYVKVPEGMEGEQDESGRLWDLLFMFAFAAKTFNGSLMKYKFISRLPLSTPWEDNEKKQNGNLNRLVTVKAIIQARDFNDPSPAIFILKPYED